jgi:hypothetical protein
MFLHQSFALVCKLSRVSALIQTGVPVSTEEEHRTDGDGDGHDAQKSEQVRTPMELGHL